MLHTTWPHRNEGLLLSNHGVPCPSLGRLHFCVVYCCEATWVSSTGRQTHHSSISRIRLVSSNTSFGSLTTFHKPFSTCMRTSPAATHTVKKVNLGRTETGGLVPHESYIARTYQYQGHAPRLLHAAPSTYARELQFNYATSTPDEQCSKKTQTESEKLLQPNSEGRAISIE